MVAEGSNITGLEKASEDGKKKIIDKILSDAEAEAKDILSYAEKQVEEVTSAAMKEANEMREEMLKKGRQEAATDRSRILSQARLDTRRKILEAKEMELSAILEETKSRLQDPSKIPNFPEVMKMITVEACVSLGGGNLTIRSNCSGIEALKKDKSAIEKDITKTTGVKTKLELVDAGISGAMAISEKGVVVDNSFVTRLERRKREVRKQLADMMF
ncbi:MAG TPA: V-type ATP synthase subunit E family protein [Candidatus Methanofastidiosa archaeon]|nr:V-type ATP synthase subunit E family protein [Candidatus Methanofastidiosa archaeon]HPR40924.1 V-type ATP synthase subunit E family protein [Candidatus Methanofastidiosa archaeon]